jgi:hypothetical protein
MKARTGAFLIDGSDTREPFTGDAGSQPLGRFGSATQIDAPGFVRGGDGLLGPHLRRLRVTNMRPAQRCRQRSIVFFFERQRRSHARLPAGAALATIRWVRQRSRQEELRFGIQNSSTKAKRAGSPWEALAFYSRECSQTSGGGRKHHVDLLWTNDSISDAASARCETGHAQARSDLFRITRRPTTDDALTVSQILRTNLSSHEYRNPDMQH